MGERLERLCLLLVMPLVHFGALGRAGCRLELVLARLLDATRLDLVVADLSVKLDVGVRLDLALNLLLLARLEFAAVALLGGLNQRRGHALLEGLLEVVEHRPVVVIGCVRLRDVVDVAREFDGDVAVDLRPEDARRLAYDLLVGDLHLALVVDGELVGRALVDLDLSLLGVLRLALLVGVEALDDLHDLCRRAEDARDVLEQEVAHEATLDYLAGVDVPRHVEHLLGIELDHLALIVLAVDGEEVQQLADVALACLHIAATARGLAV